ncbi:hypothetical protein K493DRAFT_94920 [Basidiobolus meristosporus CBS 931.73]|uniref:Uncharacterized protein n=1 Tax=Basidiobolus meristosporus CBS 931.73 TaxID=1314790 RepID=A0A1Y1X6T2_9FUNG|nr:hypothetical protein K493DRAFT_94920 [Basidiobolus meristosporus CBS 931.73]|eukprot:ORX81405.1 hypothetical protein K493DRAFT_94920 [Basidiobolus meristosporus CBS 931.73]
MVNFGSFDYVCRTLSLTWCPLVGTDQNARTIPQCYSRNVSFGDFLVFQPGALAMYIVALIMASVMLHHIRTKYTAVGRKEMVTFFWFYIVTVVLEMFLIVGVIPIDSPAYRWFTAIHVGMISTTIWCLLLNGFVGFQFAEDGTRWSLWTMRISSFIVWLTVFFIAILTFNDTGSVLSVKSPILLWIVYFLFNGAGIVIYFLMQVILVKTLSDKWPLGDIILALISFVVGQVLMLGFSANICSLAVHYIDGLFCAVLLTLFAIMMVYKYWDSITRDDLEYTVDCLPNRWEIKKGGTIRDDNIEIRYLSQ